MSNKVVEHGEKDRPTGRETERERMEMQTKACWKGYNGKKEKKICLKSTTGDGRQFKLCVRERLFRLKLRFLFSTKKCFHKDL